MTKKSPIFLNFDFKTGEGNTNNLSFSNPESIITTNELSRINDCLEEIDIAVDKGYYAAGYISYEAIYAFSKEKKTSLKNRMPLIWFGLFKNPSKNHAPDTHEPFEIGKWEISVSKSQYKQDFDKIMAAIHKEEVKEINYTAPFYTHFKGNSFAYYQQLKAAQNSRYSAFLSIYGFDILSVSPELFLEIDQNEIHIRPMKGTAHRGLTYEQDVQQKKWLENSSKNKYENSLTIAAMMQELESITVPHSISTYDSFSIEKYPTLYQMTSAAKGEINPSIHTMEVIKTLFPCISIAGVPKEKGIHLISQIENTPREVYCGTIGYITPDKNAVFNVPIRTVWIDQVQKRAHYNAGGAVTQYSHANEEYEEILTKAKVITWKQPDFQLLETMALYEGEFFLLEKHIKRLKKSATYFDFPFPLQEIKYKLQKIRESHSKDNLRVRMTVSKGGNSEIETVPLPKNNNETQKVALAKSPIQKENIFYYHKTTNRALYENFKKPFENYFDVLLWNEDNEITECTLGNIVIEMEGKLYTPPVSSGLLAGTFRDFLLKKGEIIERKIFKNELQTATQCWLINSVRKWVKIEVKTA